jgi:hypothetical protein
MLSQRDIFYQLQRTFEEGAECVVASQLFEFLKEFPQTSHITLQMVRQIGVKNQSKFEDTVILRALTFLAGDSVQVLATSFELIEDDDTVHTLTDEELSFILSDLINPLTGDVDLDIEEKVAMFFSLTEKARKFFAKLNGEKGLNV